MMQFSKWTMGVGMLLGTLLPVSAEAQVVKNDKLLSFEDPQIPVFISGTDSRLEISDEHYKDGLQSLSWTFNPGAVLSIKKDLKFEKKDPTGKDTYLSAFIVWEYNAPAQDKKIEFEILKDEIDGAIGWYHYESRFGLSVYSENGEVERYNVFHASMLIRHSNDG